jgi:hypothetical protein
MTEIMTNFIKCQFLLMLRCIEQTVNAVIFGTWNIVEKIIGKLFLIKIH